MTYKEEFYQEYLGKINKFKEINWVENYIQLKKKPNFWTILEYGEISSSNQRSSHEIRYSKMLRWLLDANENHDLGNLFASKLIAKIDSNIDYRYNPNKNKNIKTTNEALANIDIFYKDGDQKTCVAIELKQFAKEGESTGYKSQLDKYEDAVKEFIKDKEIQAHYIYLTPTGEKPSNDKWHALSYKKIIDIIEEINREYLEESLGIYRDDIKKIIYDFKDDLQRSIDILDKDISYIRENFSKEEIEFTSLLAEEISQEIESKELDRLIDLDKDNGIDIKETILLIDEYIYAQDHTPNNGVRLLMRKIYNYISEGPSLDLDLNVGYKLQDRTSQLREDLVEKYDIGFSTIQLTQGKGQGIYLYHEEEDKRLYLSGDKNGHVPNDNMKVLRTPDDEEIVRSLNIKNRTFEVEDDLIIKDKIEIKIDKNTKEVISFDRFMEDHIMKEIKVLDARSNQE